MDDPGEGRASRGGRAYVDPVRRYGDRRAQPGRCPDGRPRVRCPAPAGLRAPRSLGVAADLVARGRSLRRWSDGDGRAAPLGARSASLLAGGMLVGALATTGFANATFTNTPAPPVPSFGSGPLPDPDRPRHVAGRAPPRSRRAGPRSRRLRDRLRHPARQHERRSVLEHRYASPLSTVTFTDARPGPPTLRYYVVASAKGTWISSFSNQVVSNQCIGAINLVAGTSAGLLR